MKAGEFQKTEEYYNKALDLNKKIFGENHINVARSFEKFGTLFTAMGESEKGNIFYEKSKEIMDNLGIQI